jgi:hypothetical protein
MPRKLASALPWIIAFAALAALAAVWVQSDSRRYVQPVEQLRATDCWERTIKLMSSQPQSLKALTDIADLCYLEKQHEYHLENMRIQRQTFVEQHFVGRVMLWMVVAITLSGVALAALQLFAAFKLAVKGQGELAQEGGLELEKGKISVKSSVTGLLILVVSFAFFLVFVEKVYTIQDVRGPRISPSAPTAADAGVAVPIGELPADTAAPTPAPGPGSPPKAPPK